MFDLHYREVNMNELVEDLAEAAGITLDLSSVESILVELPGRKDRYIAKKIATDTSRMLTLLKVDAKDLPFLEMTDSDKIEVGDLVLAIGNPFGIGQTVTMGMVSATSSGSP